MLLFTGSCMLLSLCYHIHGLGIETDMPIGCQGPTSAVLEHTCLCCISPAAPTFFKVLLLAAYNLLHAL